LGPDDRVRSAHQHVDLPAEDYSPSAATIGQFPGRRLLDYLLPRGRRQARIADAGCLAGFRAAHGRPSGSVADAAGSRGPRQRPLAPMPSRPARMLASPGRPAARPPGRLTWPPDLAA